MIWATISSRSCFWWLLESFSIFSCKEHNQSDFSVDHLVMSICRVISYVVGRGCFLWPVSSHDKTLLALPWFILYSNTKLAYYSRYLLTSQFCIPVPYDEKDIFFLVLVLKGLVGLHRTVQLQLIQWLRHRLGLLWYWMVCLGNEQRSFCCFWDCIQVLHFILFCWLWGLLHFF